MDQQMHFSSIVLFKVFIHFQPLNHPTCQHAICFPPLIVLQKIKKDALLHATKCNIGLEQAICRQHDTQTRKDLLILKQLLTKIHRQLQGDLSMCVSTVTNSHLVDLSSLSRNPLVSLLLKLLFPLAHIIFRGGSQGIVKFVKALIHHVPISISLLEGEIKISQGG